MQLRFGATVYASDQLIVGTLDRVVIDPATRQVRTIALHQGHLRPRSREVPVSALQQPAGGPLQLTFPLAAVEACPPFHEERYRPGPPPSAAPADLSPLGLALPTGYTAEAPVGSAWSAGQQRVQHELEATQSSLDLSHVVLGPDSAVQSHEGVTLGTLAAVTVAAATGQLTAITISSRALPTAPISLLAGSIAGLDDDQVILHQSAAWFALWASLEPGLEVWTSDRVWLGTLQERRPDHLVVTTTDGRALRVPSEAIDRLSRHRLLLQADHARTTLWPPAGPADEIGPMTP